MIVYKHKHVISHGLAKKSKNKKIVSQTRYSY